MTPTLTVHKTQGYYHIEFEKHFKKNPESIFMMEQTYKLQMIDQPFPNYTLKFPVYLT
jgi:hypothetical protein